MENDIRLIMDLIDELDLTNDLFKKKQNNMTIN